MIVRANSTVKVKPTFSKLKLIIFFILLVIVIGLEMIFRKYLKIRVSIRIIENLQQQSSDTLLNFMKLISNLGAQGTFIILIIVIQNYTNIYKSFLFTMIVLICTLLTAFFKLIYADPRPYYANNNLVRPYGCEVGFGNPSGHSALSMAAYLAIWEIVRTGRYFKAKKILQWVLLAFILLLIFTIMLSRLYTGSNSINQILYGGS